MIIKNTAEVKSLGQTPQRYAKLAFTAWDWGVTDVSAAQDLKTTVAQNFEVLKLEDAMDERIKAIGLATPRPAMSGAEPCTASKTA